MINYKIFNFVNNIIKMRIFSSSALCEYLNYSYYSILIHNRKNCTNIVNNNIVTLKRMLINNYLSSRDISISKINYAKSKTKEKKQAKSVNLDFRELNEIYDIDKLKNTFETSIENMKQEFINNFSIRSVAGSIELIKVKVDEKQYELQELAQIVRNPKLVVLNVNFPTAIPSIVKAINESGLNINPQQDGTTLYLPLPMVTKEYREKLIKGSKAVYIKYRDEIKDSRSKVIKILKNSKTSPDAIRRSTTLVEKFTDQYLDIIDNILKSKQKELSGDSK